MITSLLLFHLLYFASSQALSDVGDSSSQRHLQDSTTTTRIVGGWNAVPTRFEYFTLLQVFRDNVVLRCGGSLIHPDVVLTAAHCLGGDVRSIVAWVNYTRSDKMTGHEYRAEAEEWIPHPDYDRLTGEFDVGIIKLKRTIVGVVPVRINKGSSIPKVGQSTTVFGFGVTERGKFPERLKRADVDVVSHVRCNAMSFYDGRISDESMICAGVRNGGKDACAGDSGGPLIIGGGTAKADLQVGIVSWGMGCGEVNHPGVYTRVSTYADWIEKTICKISNNFLVQCLLPSVRNILHSGSNKRTSKSWATLVSPSKGASIQRSGRIGTLGRDGETNKSARKHTVEMLENRFHN